MQMSQSVLHVQSLVFEAPQGAGPACSRSQGPPQGSPSSRGPAARSRWMLSQTESASGQQLALRSC